MDVDKGDVGAEEVGTVYVRGVDEGGDVGLERGGVG